MLVHRHAEKALVALNGRLPEPASVYVARLRQMETEPNESVALEVARLQYAHGHRETGGTNGSPNTAGGGRSLSPGYGAKPGLRSPSSINGIPFRRVRLHRKRPGIPLDP